MTRLEGIQWQGHYAEAYVRAVAAAAGFICTKPDLDSGHKVDWLIAAAGDDETTREPKLDVQVKSTVQARLATGASQFTFDRDLYAWAIKPQPLLYHPRVVVLVQLPDDPRAWMDQADEQLTVRHCAYWTSLRGHGALAETQGSVSVQFARDRKFDVAGLVALMAGIEGGDWP
jgi:hypothetical protein